MKCRFRSIERLRQSRSSLLNTRDPRAGDDEQSGRGFLSPNSSRRRWSLKGKRKGNGIICDYIFQKVISYDPGHHQKHHRLRALSGL
jgi:hypothetical protein